MCDGTGLCHYSYKANKFNINRNEPQFLTLRPTFTGIWDGVPDPMAHPRGTQFPTPCPKKNKNSLEFETILCRISSKIKGRDY